MYTQCPECSTIFRVSERELEAADGEVRCGECMEVFDARRHRLEDLPSRTEAPDLGARPGKDADGVRETAAAHAGVDIDILLTAPAEEREAPTLHQRAQSATAPAKPRNTGEKNKSARLDQSAVLFEPSPKEGRGALSTFVWSILILLALALLISQYGYRNRLEFVRYEPLRPALERLCALAQCELPPRRDIEAVAFIDRQVQSHPRYDDALLITATFINKATFTQPLPTVELALRDIDGRLVATRHFQPAEYLNAAHGEFGPGTEAHLLLEVADPGEEAVSFEFTFH